MRGFEFKHFNNINESIMAALSGLGDSLDPKFSERLRKMITYQNFWEGYHWEDLPEQDSLALTFNYCKVLLQKLVSFELGKSFTFNTHKVMEGKKVTNDGRTLFEFLEDVWEDNKQYILSEEIGYMKAITGEAWVQVRSYLPGDDDFEDPYGEYPEGRIRLMLLPSSVVFPEYDPHDRDNLIRLTIMYTYDKLVQTPILNKARKQKTLFKQVWTPDTCVTQDGNDRTETPNKYKVIPFALIKNMTQPGKSGGESDLEDLIPLNIEYNIKSSDVSEIIDYHAAPVTIVYGAKVGNLEKGANKMWGGLSKDARVENLELHGDLSSSTNYIESIKTAMCEVAGVPNSKLTGIQGGISNTSGIALHYMNEPLVDKNNLKKLATEDGLERLNKLIILVALLDGYIFKPTDVSNRDFYHTEVTLPDNLPKDDMILLQQLQTEINMGIESKRGALKRLGREDIDNKLREIEEESQEEDPANDTDDSENDPQINSGILNGQTPIEQVRKELTGKNGGAVL